MFYSVSRREEAAFNADHLQNPLNSGNPMVLAFYRQYVGTAFYRAISKKAVPRYWDSIAKKYIPKRKWTPEMNQYIHEKVNEVPNAAYKFKMTYVGYFMILLFAGFFIYLTYDSLRPKPNYAEEIRPLKESINAGDTFYGRYMKYKPGERVANAAGFGWFKVNENKNGILKVAFNKEMSNVGTVPSDQLNQTDFETKTYPMKIIAQENYQVDLKSQDNLLEISFSEKGGVK